MEEALKKMTTKRTRTVIAVALSLIMALAYMPCAAFAAEGDQTPDVEALQKDMEEAKTAKDQAEAVMNTAKDAMDQAKAEWDKKKAAADTAQATADESATAAENAEAARDGAFEQAKTDAKAEYDAAAEAYDTAVSEYNAAKTDYDKKVEELDPLTSQKTNLEGVVSELQSDLTAAQQEKETLVGKRSSLQTAVTAATNQWNADKQNAQANLEQAQAAYDETGYTFINNKINALGSQFLTIDEMIETCKTYTDTTLNNPVTFNGKQISKIADVANDALFLSIVKSNCTKENLLFAMDMIDESNTLRQAEGKSVMGVSYQLMGAAIMSNSYTLYSWGHDLFEKNGKTPQGYANTDSFWAIGPASQGNENLAASTAKYSSAYEPYEGWYDEEKAALQEAVDSGQWPGLTMQTSTRDIWSNYSSVLSSQYGQVGHYLTLKNEEYTTTGAAVTYNTGTVPTNWRGRATQSFNDDKTNSITTTQCRNEINAAFADTETALQSAQSAVDALESKPQAVKDAENAVTENEKGITQAEQDITNISGQIEEKNGQITTLTSQILTKQDEVDAAETAKNAKETAKNTAEGVKNEKEAANTKAQALDVEDPETYKDYPELKTLADDAAAARTQADTDSDAAKTAASEAEEAEGLYNTAKSDYDTKKKEYDKAAADFNTAQAVYKYAVAVSIDGAKIVLSKTTFTYNGKPQKPTIETIDGMTLTENTDYTVAWADASSKNAGTYKLTVTGIDGYKGTAEATYKIIKAKNPLTVKAKTGTVKYSKLKKKNQTLKLAAVIKTVKKGQGKVTYVKASGNKKITINKTTGVVTVKKGLKKNKYKVKVKVTAAGNKNYNKITKNVTFTVKVK